MKITHLRLFVGIALLGFSLCQTQAAFNVGQSIFIDFGKNDTTNGIIMPAAGTMDVGAGNSTGVADSYGNYWNNAWTNTSTAGGPVPPTALTNLVTSTNIGTGIDLAFSQGWESNGFNNGGLLSPDPALLGNFASPNATGDYFFINKPFTAGQSGIATMTFFGLDPSLSYDFKMFATRAQNEVRRTEYSITDINGTHSFLLQTSGAGLGAGGYNGNNNTFAYLTGIVPDEAGSITLSVRVDTSDFGYIGAMELTAVPEPGTAMLMAAAGFVGLIVYRRRRSDAGSSKT